MSARVAVVAIAAILSCAVLAAAWALREVTVPPDPDHFRDLGTAQMMLDGRWTEDVAAAGERAWYPPLAPALVAATSRLTEWPLPLTHVRVGLVAGILPVLGLAVLAWKGWGPLAACGTVASACVLAQGTGPGWASATYSPWLFSSTLMLAPSSLSLALLHARRWAWAGFAAGVCGLGDLGFTALLSITAALEISRSRNESGAMKRAAMFFVPCLATASIHLLPLLLRYGVSVQNRLPGTWQAPYGPAIGGPWGLLNVGLVLALIGLRSAWTSYDDASRVLRTWAFVAASLWLYTLIASRVGAPVVVPDWHFWTQLRAVEALLGGVGLAALAEATRLANRPWLVVGTLLTLIGLHTPMYLSRADLTVLPRTSREIAAGPMPEITKWLRQHTPTGARIASDHRTSLLAVLPAARHAVCLDPYFSHPFIPYSRLHAAHELAMRTGRNADYVLSKEAPTCGREVVALAGFKVWHTSHCSQYAAQLNAEILPDVLSVGRQ